ncbi:MAG TPA: hypothetical protein VFC25_18225 [Verrucomicrobiae bacterium]|nr:hypothetical protein [Verrucomicrobiae bacterium]
MSAQKKKGEEKSDPGVSYNQFKTFEGMRYTGMKIGRSHRWHYDEGFWKETKITPDLWQVNYAVTKRRVGHAPEGSGVPVGTEYHWYILAHQNVTKLDANAYTTSLTGLKFKIAHKRAGAEKWSATEPTQRKRMIAFLQSAIEQLEKAPAEQAPEIAAGATAPDAGRAAVGRAARGRGRRAAGARAGRTPSRPRANGRGRATRVH